MKNKQQNERFSKIKNQLLLRRGGFSLIITVLFLAFVIIFNLLVGALSDRFDLQYDLSADKENTVTKENVEYIKSIDTPIDITVCAGEENYVAYMSSYAPQLYSLADDYSDYYSQTVRFIKKYPDYNKKITVKFVDMYNDTAYAEIYNKYSSEGLTYGDVIVSAVIEKDGEKNERHKVVTFKDIYNMVEDSSDSYASMYGYSSYTISGNQVENAISGAIDYVLGVDKKAAMITGHSSDTTDSLFDAYEKLLTSNNFKVDRIDSLAINELSSDYNVVVIIQPTVDFQESELTALNLFLENGGNLQKSLVYVGGAAAQSTPNFNEFLADWGIVINEGKLFETSGQYAMSGDPTTLYTTYSGYGYLLLSENAAISIGTAVDSNTEVQAVIPSPDTVAIAPLDAAADWNGYKESDLGSFALMALAEKTGYTDDAEEVSSAVFAFATADFVSPAAEGTMNDTFITIANDYFDEGDISNMDFEIKQITSTTFVPKESDANTIQIIFVILLPIAMLITAVVIYIRRKNAR